MVVGVHGNGRMDEVQAALESHPVILVVVRCAEERRSLVRDLCRATGEGGRTVVTWDCAAAAPTPGLRAGTRVRAPPVYQRIDRFFGAAAAAGAATHVKQSCIVVVPDVEDALAERASNSFATSEIAQCIEDANASRGDLKLVLVSSVRAPFETIRHTAIGRRIRDGGIREVVVDHSSNTHTHTTRKAPPAAATARARRGDDADTRDSVLLRAFVASSRGHVHPGHATWTWPLAGEEEEDDQT